LIGDHPEVSARKTRGDAWISDRADGKAKRTKDGLRPVNGKPGTRTHTGISRHIWFGAMQMIGDT